MDINLTGGELKHVPMVDFSKTYSEDELFRMADISKSLQQEVNDVIPDYYRRRK